MLETLLSNRTVSVLWEALPRILSAGLTMTIPLTLVSFTLAMVLAVAVALVQYAKVPVLSQLARFYIWVIRGTLSSAPRMVSAQYAPSLKAKAMTAAGKASSMMPTLGRP